MLSHNAGVGQRRDHANTMNPLDELAEQRMREAEARGELSGLPGEGRPLDLDDDAFVPEHLRMAYRVLRNANCLPPELEQRREIRELEDLLRHVNDTTGPEAREARRRLTALRVELDSRRGAGSSLSTVPGYEGKLEHRFRRR